MTATSSVDPDGECDAENDAGHHLAGIHGHHAGHGPSATQLNATASVPGTFVYTPAAGTVLAVGTHTLATVFSPSDATRYNSASASTTVTVNPAVKTTPVIDWKTPSAIVQGTALSSAQLNASTIVPGTLAYTPGAGTVLAAGTHTLTASFTPSDATLYTTATAFMSLTVNAAPKTTPVITWPAPAAITQGTALSGTQLTATATVPGAFVYTPAAGTVLATGTHPLNVTFTPTDTTRYNTATAATTITVNPAPKTTPVITWPAPAAITQGTALSTTQLTATSTVAGAFVYTPAAGTVLATGTHPLNVTFTPTDTTRYNTATAATTITVNPAPKTTPVITWPAPAAITQGTALSGTQFTATATVPGAFVYTPAAGTVLATGTHTLSLTFTPADTTRYNTATAATTITVNPAPKTTPVITWPAAAAITQGTALSGTQLTATVHCGWRVRLYPGGRDRAGDRHPSAQRDLHAYRHHALHHRDRRDDDHGESGAQDDAGHHLARSRRHHAGHGPLHDPAYGHRHCGWRVRLYPGGRDRPGDWHPSRST